MDEERNYITEDAAIDNLSSAVSADERKALRVLVRTDIPMRISFLATTLGKTVKQVIPIVTFLELKGLAIQLPGKTFLVNRENLLTRGS